MLAAQRSTPPANAPVAWSTITYLSGTTVYLEVGERQGVRVGTVFRVVRHGATIGELTARYLASNRAACTVAKSDSAFVIGDSVAFSPVLDQVQPAPTTIARAPEAQRRGRSPLRGRFGIRYLAMDQGGTTIRQPSLDVRLDGTRLGGTALGLVVDARTQRTSVTAGSTPAAAPPGETRVYQAAVLVQSGPDGARWAVGRQFASALSPIGIFDGAALDLNGARWSGGALAGTEPDVITFSPSGSTTEYGVWVQRHNARGSATPWTATMGAVGSYDRGEINREFLYLRGTVNTRRFSLYAAQEIDVNRGWKRRVEGSFATPTATFATAQLNLSDGFGISGGIDSRRSVRLYRDFINPEIAFDDAFRQGYWGDVTIRASRHLRLGGEWRSNGGGSEGTARAMTASLIASGLGALGIGFRARATTYSGPASNGTLASFALDLAPRGAWQASINGGVRTGATSGAAPAATRLAWTGADLDVSLRRSLYLLLSYYRETGSPSATRQAYAALSWRF